MFFHVYGFLISLGILAGLWVAEKFKKELSFSLLDPLFWVLTGGIIGARIYHLIDYWSYYAQNLIEVFYLWQGGLGIFGGIIGGIFSLWLFKKHKKLTKKEFLIMLDLGALGLPLGQAIGRWANYFNQELYGWPTNLPWGIYIKPENRLPGFGNFQKFHPLFLYESLGCLAIFTVIYVVADLSLRSSRNKFRYYRFSGSLFFLYLFLYGLLRFFLEFLRPEGWVVRLPLTMNLVRVNQLVAVFLMAISAIYLITSQGVKGLTPAGGQKKC